MMTSSLLNMRQGLFSRPGSAVWTVMGEGVPNVDHGENAGHQRNLFSFQAVWIASTIPFLVMAIGDVNRGSQIWMI